MSVKFNFMEDQSEVKVLDTRKFNPSFYKKFGKRILSILNNNKEINASIEKLEKLCDKYSDSDTYRPDGWGRNKILEWAYTGVVLSSLIGFSNPEERLEYYIKNIEDTLQHNKYSDPAFYVQEIFNEVFKPRDSE